MGRILIICTTVGLLIGNAVHADGIDRRVVILNMSNGQSINRFYATAANGREVDMLQEFILPPHQYVQINFDNDTGICVVKIRAVFANGRNLEDTLNVCAAKGYALNEFMGNASY